MKIFTLLRRTTMSLALIVLVTGYSWSQNDADKAYIISKTNVKALNELEKKFKQSDEQVRLKASQVKAKAEIINSKGQLGVLYSIDKDGNLVYAYDDNVNAAITGRTNKIWVGGALGLNLTGEGIQIGVWESGYALSNHQEYVSRVTNAGDGGSVTQHGSHTAGTMLAAGIVASARGMASKATLKNYTSTGMAAEAAAFAAAGGIIANNSNTPSGVAGEYDANARDMDNVAYNAPYYLHVKSAGNDGDPYGTIYTNQLAKNLLVVGNCDDVLNYTGPSSVVMATSSSYGPPKDWRVKPDITNNGTAVYSCNNTSTTSYVSLSGTSMSTPATTGTVVLLQQHYKSIKGVYMRAATVRSLLINTADEVGTYNGPDFRSGWGLVNAEKAAQVISNNGTTSLVSELTLNNGATYTRTITTDGSTPFALTIAWNDPAGALTTTNACVLVNDLDVRITGNGNTYYPWIMVPNAAYSNYTDAAQKGDNFRDNVEKIEASLPAGTYTVTVSHKGTLSSGSQDFSLIVRGLSSGSQYTLATSNVGQGAVALNPVGGTYASGTVVTLTATPAVGWIFSGWSGGLTGTTNPSQITMNSNVSVTATFTQAPTFTLTTSVVGEGTIALNPTGGVYPQGTSVALTATPSSGWRFVNWSGDLTGTTNPAQITMSNAKNVTATFELSPNQAPVAVINGPYSGTVNVPINFSSAGSNDSDGTITNYLWDFGNGSTSNLANPSYTYTAANTYNVSLTVTDNLGLTSTLSTTAAVVAAPTGYALLPYTTGFENGALDEYWVTKKSGTTGRIQVTKSYTPRTGSYHLTMDISTGTAYVQNEAWLKLNLAGKTQVALAFYWKEFSDETHTQDGVYISDNGGTSFVKVYSLTGGNTTYRLINLDIDQLAATNGLTLSGTFVIKFQQYDNSSITSDGFGFDDITVTGTGDNSIDESVHSDLQNISIYPNPAQEQLNIVIPFEENLAYTIKVMNVYGSLVKTEKGNAQHYSMDVADLPSGTYIVSIEHNGNIHTSKIVIVH